MVSSRRARNAWGSLTIAFIAQIRRHIGRDHLLLAALCALSWGLMINFGSYDGSALLLVMAALLLIALATRLDGPRAGRGIWATAVALVAIGGVRYAPRFGVTGELVLDLVLTVSTVLAVLACRRWPQYAALGAAIAALFGMVAAGWRWRSADIDLFAGLQNASEAVIRGQNPYTGTFHAMSQTAPGVFAERLIHFPYLPGAILLAVPGRLIGDARIMSVIAFTALFVAVMVVARASPVARSRPWVLALCAATPTTVAMVHWAWLDVYSAAAFAGWLAIRHSHRRWAVVLLATSLTIKPYILLAVVPLWLWSARVRREMLVAAVGAAAVCLPFLLMTGPRNFYDDVFAVYGVLGFRFDGLTISAGWHQLTGALLPFGVSIAVGSVLAILCLYRRPRDLADALLAGAFLSTAAFLLAKWAFLNYYFIPEWLVTLAIAARGVQMEAADIGLPATLDRLFVTSRRTNLLRPAHAMGPRSWRRLRGHAPF